MSWKVRTYLRVSLATVVVVDADLVFFSGHAALTLRSRLRCIVMKKDEESGKVTTKPSTNLLVLNEVVIDRGPSPYLSNIDLYLDGKLITSVQGDGLIISTPTGKTIHWVNLIFSVAIYSNV